MEIELPFKAEYAKTGRANCKGCKSKIEQGVLRIAVMVQSTFHDGKQPNWHHEKCLFVKHRPASAGDIENFENLRVEDQKRVQEEIENCTAVVTGSSKKGAKRTKAEINALKDFGIEYAKSGRAACRGCEQKILKDQLRVRKTVYDTEVGMKYGGQPLWHHVECFAQVRAELGWLASGENLPGFGSLKKEDKEDVKKALPLIKETDMPEAKKAKIEKLDEEDEKSAIKLEETVEKQNKKLFKIRDQVKNEMNKDHILDLLQDNGQEPVKCDSEKLLDQVADLLTFGAILPCPECKGKQLLFQKSGYLCTGDLTEWTKCKNLIKTPQRKPCKIADYLKSVYPFLGNVKSTTEDRAIRYIPPSAATISKNLQLKKKDELDGPKVKRERPPLYNIEIAIYGVADEDNIKKRITKLGGKCVSSISGRTTTVVLSTPAAVKAMGSRMRKAKSLGIHVIPVEYLDAVESDGAGAISYITSMSLCDWGTDPSARIQEEEAKSSKSKSIYTKSVPKSITLKVKGGLAVDPDSGLEDIAHVYVTKDKVKYSVVLGETNIQTNRNSYYKMQILESDGKNNFWVFRSWGRIGTTIGSNKLEKCTDLYHAIATFDTVYFERTGNHFKNRANFKKVPGKMYPIDIDYVEDAKHDLHVEHKVKSELPEPVQDVVKIMFDIDTMKRTMTEFDLDMEKMPLGKLSQKQIQEAYKVLTDIYNLIEQKGSNVKFIDATNRFYTLIPHNFGTQSPPLLDTCEQIENLRQMLDSLMEIEYAYGILKSEDSNEDVNPIDKHYNQLKTKLEPVDKNSKEFALLQEYVTNTHGETHKLFKLEIVNVFKVVRQGEARRYKPFKMLHNRRLLWHGSRLTNFCGILSHGLKIAPPEAPVTGYMFGKGIYFADMVSKSANYCATTPHNSTGFMLLSEVALGDMMECTAAKYVTQLPKGKHSCFGRGRTMPDPSGSIFREDGVEIPLGKPVTNKDLSTSLLYNEFIVYDIAQVNIQYLFHMHFKHF